MKEHDLAKIEDIYHSALERTGADRESFISIACRDDPRLAAEVRSLISSYENAPTFMSRPVMELGLGAVAETEEIDLTGETIGQQYCIIDRLGSGGMGNVYLATDLKLGRRVALKFLTPAFLNNPWAQSQLRKEAEAIAKVTHKNVCTVFDFEEIDDHRFIVMEHLQGEPLSELIKRNAINAAEVRDLAEQIVDAIAAAHDHDIIHRDIKPGNIFVQANGEVKVLDFGLAKIVRERPNGNSQSDQTTRRIFVGTPAYMSPEQIKREKLDFRSDIFGIGTLLFEMASGGHHPFSRNSEAETIAAIIDEKTPLDRLPWSKVQPELRPVIRKCLQKKKEDRYQSAVELLLDLQNPVPEPRRLLGLHPVTFAGLVLAAILVFAIVFVLFRNERDYGVVVLPFANETRNSAYDYLADGMAESLSERLSGTDGFKIIGFGRVAGFQPDDLPASAAAREVNADLVLTGRLYLEDGRLRVATKLTDAAGTEVRNSEHELDTEDIPAAEQGIMIRLFSGLDIRASELTSKLSGSSGEAANGEAARLYRQGRHFWRKRDKENLQKAIAAFQTAVDLDPEFAKAHAGLANSFVLLNSVAYGSIPPKDAFARARNAARQAIELDPMNAEAHTALGVVLTKHDWNWQEAEREYRLAIKIDPENAGAHYWLSGLLGITGRTEEAIAAAERAKELDPFSPLVEYNLARAYYYARQFDRSLEVLNRQTVTEKNHTSLRFHIGYCNLMLGRYDDAVLAFKEVYDRNKMLGIAALGYTYGRMNWRKEALKLIAEMEQLAKESYVPPQEFAVIYIGLNDRDKAFQYLEAAYNERYGSLSAIKAEALFDPIRDDPRYAALIDKMGLS